MSKKEEIKIPILGLVEWRKNNVPPEVWDDPYLQAYLRRAHAIDAVAVILLTITAVMAGMQYMQYIMR